MAGFVAMHIAADQAVDRDVLVVGIILFGQFHVEQLVEPLAEHFFAAHACHQLNGIVRDMEGIIPRIAFDEALAIGLERIEILFERAVSEAGRGETVGRVEYIPVG